jgi:hypothetical protein
MKIEDDKINIFPVRDYDGQGSDFTNVLGLTQKTGTVELFKGSPRRNGGLLSKSGIGSLYSSTTKWLLLKPANIWSRKRHKSCSGKSVPNGSMINPGMPCG